MIEIIGQSIGIESLDRSLSNHLAPQIEFRLRELLDTALKFSTHAKRKTLTCQDINDALKSRNLEPLYGFSTCQPTGTTTNNKQEKTTPPTLSTIAPDIIQAQDYNVKFQKVSGLYFKVDPTVSVQDLMNQSMPHCPLEPSFHIHWLAVDGIQPRVPENLSSDFMLRKRKVDPHAPTTNESSFSAQHIEIKPLVKHVLSQEMQLYYEKITSALRSAEDQYERQQAAFTSLREDSGLHQLLPYLCRFLANEVLQCRYNLYLLTSVLRAMKCLLANPSLHASLELYLHQLLPAILTCVLAKKLCHNPTDDHWQIREQAAQVLAIICQEFGTEYEHLVERISKTFYETYVDSSLPLTSHYGAMIGMMYLGPLCMECLLFPTMASYVSALEDILYPDLDSSAMLENNNNHNPVRKLEAQYCFGILVVR